jgi:site-specific DNA recombinase
MSAEVASRLDSEKCYGIWWFNRRRTKTYQEAVNGPDGKRYKKRVKITQRPKEEWIAVPVPDSGIPRERVDLAREAIKDRIVAKPQTQKGQGYALCWTGTAAEG